MPIREPGWWYRPAPSVAAMLLRPVAWVYGRAVVARLRRATPYRSRLPVICVGNLVAGGTGKTPLALHLARLLLDAGHRPAFLSRGHGGRLAGPHLVDRFVDTADDVGDEPLLLARTAPAFIARDRAAGARAIEQTDATHIIMDDGLQNPGLAKDLTLAMIDAARGIGNGHVIPAGPLRAPLAFQATLVDAIVLGDARDHSEVSEAANKSLPEGVRHLVDVPVLRAHRRLVMPNGVLPNGVISNGPWVAFAGIGHPDGFFAMLEQNGVRLAAKVAFADHHAFTSADAQRLLDLAARHGAHLITTEKDQARLSRKGDARERLSMAVTAPRLELAFSAEDQTRLDTMLAALAANAT